MVQMLNHPGVVSFLRLATEKPDWNCSRMSENSQNYNAGAEWADSSPDPSIIAEATYVLSNIIGRFPFML